MAQKKPVKKKCQHAKKRATTKKTASGKQAVAKKTVSGKRAVAKKMVSKKRTAVGLAVDKKLATAKTTVNKKASEVRKKAGNAQAVEKSRETKRVQGKDHGRLARKKQLLYRVRVFGLVSLGFAILLGGVVWLTVMRADKYQKGQEGFALELENRLAEYYDDYAKEVPKLEFDLEELEELEEEMEDLRPSKYDALKERVRDKLGRLRQFAQLRKELVECMQEGVLKSSVNDETIGELGRNLEKLGESYRQVLAGKMEEIKKQRQAILDLRLAVAGMFIDEKMEIVRQDLARAEYEEVKARAEGLLQRDIGESYHEVLQRVEAEISERERLAEEARRKAAEEYRRRQQQIAEAWKIINVPYWSQNGEGVKNGCEAAALLMGLQAKGYLGGMHLRTYAEMMPKSEDPFAGFRGNIFESAGSDAPFWIAPGALAAFGRSSSGNGNVVDITGASLDVLDAEVAAGNPVVIYLTLHYAGPKAWRFGAPANLHVVLLTGYNAITGVQRVTDPLTLNGETYHDLSRATVEAIYNATGKRAVVIR